MRRNLIIVILLGAFGLPLLLPLRELVSPSSWAAWSEGGRILELTGHSITLIATTLAFVLPPGLALAVLLFRTDLPGARLFQIILGLALFVPLPLFALAWQGIGGGGWRPWTQGVVFAAFVHAAAALPWVVWLAGLGLSRVEPELEEDALTSVPGWRVLWKVSIPRASAAIGLAVIWVVLQAAGEITVTDLAVVRTFAEEVYTQFVTDVRAGLGRAVAIALPMTLIACVAVGGQLRRWTRQLSVDAQGRPPRVFSLGKSRWIVFAVVLVVILTYSFVPLASLIRQAGGGEEWSVSRLAIELRRATSMQWLIVLDSLLWAFVAGLLSAAIALVSSWIALDSRWLRRLLFALAVALWATPGPVLGFGLKEAIELLMDLEDLVLTWTTARPIRAVLYDLSTPAPVLWAHVARLFPYALAICWPAVRDIPRDLRESAQVDGASRWTMFRQVVWSATRRAYWVAVVIVTALALGELATSKIVQVPNRPTYVQELFSQMHYGATATTAALALVLLAPASFAFVVLIWLRQRK